MRSYLLLRNNQETGPFTLDELLAANLQNTDLIWIDGSSNSWKYPDEIESLKPFVQPRTIMSNMPQEPLPKSAVNSKSRVFVAMPPTKENEDIAPNINNTVPELETKYVQPLDEIKEMYVAHLTGSRNKGKRRLLKSVSPWVAVLAFSLLTGSFLVKRLMDVYNDKGIVKNTAVIAAKAKEATPEYRNALATEIVPVDTTLTHVTKKTAKKTSLKKLVSVYANDYKVGVFGGIDNLMLSINNKSDHVLDVVTVEIKYLKPNGETIRKENYFIKTVAPKSIETLLVPPTKRGVKIKYRITNIKSHQYKASMVEI